MNVPPWFLWCCALVVVSAGGCSHGGTMIASRCDPISPFYAGGAFCEARSRPWGVL